jgi:hypothetical protein
MKKAIIYLVVFLALQLMAGGIMQAVWILMKGPGAQLDAIGTILTMALFSVATITLFLFLKWAEVSRHWVQTQPWGVLFWCVLAALGAIIPSTWLQEQMPELPNIVEEEFDMILRNRYGYFVVGLLAPLAEEMVFRGAILRTLLRWNSKPWGAIIISAIFFSAAHMNPAQIPHTLLIGILLGWLYYRTDSIVPGVVYHWVNNTVAYVLYNLYPNPDMTLSDLFGGNQQTVLMAVGFSLCILIPSLLQLNIRMKK